MNRSPAVLLLALFLGGSTYPAWAEEKPPALLQKSQALLAQIEGEITLPGLTEPVEVLRDRWGVPHIYAKNMDDLFFAM